jgi:hypothetical protein
MQRVRVGLTGLACVFLMVFLAAAFFGLARREPDVVPVENAAAINGADPAATEDGPKEPLAELGVTPGNLPSTEQPAPAPVGAPPAAVPPAAR